MPYAVGKKEGRTQRKGVSKVKDLKLHAVDPKDFSPAALAFIGDGVFELLVRERLLEAGNMPAGKLHRLSVARVNAQAQARAYRELDGALNEEEQSILRRGRNANTGKVPQSCTPEEYRKATAVEALFGYLYLKGEIVRLCGLFALIDPLLADREAGIYETGL